MTRPIQPNKTYGVLHTENYFSFLGFAKKVGSNETQKIDVFLDDKLIDTIEANEFIQKIDDMYDVESKAFTYNLPTQYIGTKAIISFKNHDSGEELLNSPYTLIDKNHEKFNEVTFFHSLNEPISNEIKNMYCPNSIGFLATKENMEDEEFVEYINQIMNDFPEYDFKALYFDKNSVKEIKEKFKNNSSLELIELKDIKDIFESLEVYLSNYKNFIEINISNSLQYSSKDIMPINLYLDLNISINKFEKSNPKLYQKFFDNLEYFEFESINLDKCGNNFHKIFFRKMSEKYDININFNEEDTIKMASVYYHLRLGLRNHKYFKFMLNFIEKWNNL
ncbi:hypothetical protein OZY48_09615 [Aliarcobacter cryaerophilus]|uniref:hypothetical protein n=1 Tax=Aliarcobacter cryaerophilus TaxID=28198 RepID=UPI003BAFBF31